MQQLQRRDRRDYDELGRIDDMTTCTMDDLYLTTADEGILLKEGFGL